MSATLRDRDARVCGTQFTFGFIADDICHLTALSLRLYSLGRPTLGAKACDIGTRIRNVFNAGGVCGAGVVTMNDFSHLLQMVKYADTEDLRKAILAVADRIWCGLTLDDECPITKTWGMVS